MRTEVVAAVMLIDSPVIPTRAAAVIADGRLKEARPGARATVGRTEHRHVPMAATRTSPRGAAPYARSCSRLVAPTTTIVVKTQIARAKTEDVGLTFLEEELPVWYAQLTTSSKQFTMQALEAPPHRISVSRVLRNAGS
jgi:hypothetical protein